MPEILSRIRIVDSVMKVVKRRLEGDDVRRNFIVRSIKKIILNQLARNRCKKFDLRCCANAEQKSK